MKEYIIPANDPLSSNLMKRALREVDQKGCLELESNQCVVLDDMKGGNERYPYRFTNFYDYSRTLAALLRHAMLIGSNVLGDIAPITVSRLVGDRNLPNFKYIEEKSSQNASPFKLTEKEEDVNVYNGHFDMLYPPSYLKANIPLLEEFNAELPSHSLYILRQHTETMEVTEIAVAIRVRKKDEEIKTSLRVEVKTQTITNLHHLRAVDDGSPLWINRVLELLETEPIKKENIKTETALKIEDSRYSSGEYEPSDTWLKSEGYYTDPQTNCSSPTDEENTSLDSYYHPEAISDTHPKTLYESQPQKYMYADTATNLKEYHESQPHKYTCDDTAPKLKESIGAGSKKLPKVPKGICQDKAATGATRVPDAAKAQGGVKATTAPKLKARKAAESKKVPKGTCQDKTSTGATGGPDKAMEQAACKATSATCVPDVRYPPKPPQNSTEGHNDCLQHIRYPPKPITSEKNPAGKTTPKSKKKK